VADRAARRAFWSLKRWTCALRSRAEYRALPLCADSVEKVENPGLPKSQPIGDLSECCRSTLCHFRYTAHTLLERKIGGVPQLNFLCRPLRPLKNQSLQKTNFFNTVGAKLPLDPNVAFATQCRIFPLNADIGGP
jgi:hypothetical protein